jgi:hypothetical protein
VAPVDGAQSALGKALTMNTSIDGFYAAYLTGSNSEGFAMLVFRSGTIVGVDAAGVKYDGTYSDTRNGFAVKLTLSIPPNTLLIQGATSGPQGEKSELAFQLPLDFTSRPYIRIDANHGPVNAKLTKLRELQ